MDVPIQTAEIFEILSKGQFISSNSSNRKISDLYKIIDDEQNYENLYDFFININFVLEKGDEYYYFSRPESKIDLERKIETAFKWIDVIDFLKTFDNSFGVGYRFSPSDLLVRIKIDAELETKLEGLKKHTGKEKHQEIIEKLLTMLVNDSFIELENEITHQYKVLASFKYLEQIILTINIPDNIRNEIPE
ncbi:MAG: hypothetical protein PHR13_09035 [Dysgonamonadaceae bacterium]|nr:hypothetical protein [Dysgonamonadaceae bacterium]MDD3900690.1 hypothetical protein [Dysgonamonadaceae bacterium]